ncbi:MAG: nucleoside hydrolase [Bacteroidota bacterium]
MNRHTRRNFLRLTGTTATVALALGSKAALIVPNKSHSSTAPTKLIVDADTANEVDDLFAIAIALLDPNLEIVGITSAQWHTANRGSRDKVGASQKMNEDILRLMGKEEIPHPMGANFPMVSTYRPQASAAADFIIEQALAMPEGEKLHVVILGPATNIASAVLKEARIIPRLVVTFLGFWHHPATNTWNKREFNTLNDPNAIDLLLNTAGLEVRLMTASTSRNLVFDKTEVDEHLKGKGGISDYLVNRWETFDRDWQKTDKEKKHWVMWDVAGILAIADPGLATESLFNTPHDNLDRQIGVFTKIDVEGMKARYWELFDGYQTRR